MRHIILALMIALLPVRGWVGDVMATDMASSRTAHLQSAAEMADGHANPAMAAPHLDHASVQTEAAQALPDCASHGAGGQTPAADAHCDSCTMCQACHTVALSPAAPDLASLPFSRALPHSPAAQFASAVTSLGQKPPIS